MRTAQKLFALVGVTLLVLSVVGPAAAGAAVTSDATANDGDDAYEGNDGDDTEFEGNDGDETEFEDGEDDSFGQLVSSYVHALKSGNDGSVAGNDGDDTVFGQLVSAFVTANNPAADKHGGERGPPDHAKDKSKKDKKDKKDKKRGPPDHAKDKKDKKDGDDGDDDGDDDGGPPGQSKES